MLVEYSHQLIKAHRLMTSASNIRVVEPIRREHMARRGCNARIETDLCDILESLLKLLAEGTGGERSAEVGTLASALLAVAIGRGTETFGHACLLSFDELVALVILFLWCVVSRLTQLRSGAVPRRLTR